MRVQIDVALLTAVFANEIPIPRWEFSLGVVPPGMTMKMVECAPATTPGHEGQTRVVFELYDEGTPIARTGDVHFKPAVNVPDGADIPDFFVNVVLKIQKRAVEKACAN